jgi:hypothetical protein
MMRAILRETSLGARLYRRPDDTAYGAQALRIDPRSLFKGFSFYSLDYKTVRPFGLSTVIARDRMSSNRNTVDSVCIAAGTKLHHTGYRYGHFGGTWIAPENCGIRTDGGTHAGNTE